MMRPSSLALETAKRFRRHRKPTHIVRWNKGVPVNDLKWVCEQLRIEDAAYYIVPTPGRNPHRRSLQGGKRSRWSDLRTELEVPNSDNKLLLTVHFSRRSEQKYASPIGYLGVYRQEAFSDEELSALKDIAGFLGDYMFEVYEAQRRNACARIPRRLKEITSTPSHPGTVIKHAQGTVHRALRAHASYFATLDDDAITIEYFQKMHRNRPTYSEVRKTHHVSGDFEGLCHDKAFFSWMDHGVDQPLGTILAEYVADEGRWRYLCSVVKTDGAPVAVWIFQFSSHQILFRELYESVIRMVSAETQKFAHYLYQRRSKQVIINPIFRHRDTKVQSDLVFTLMPFSEPWSNRIWEKLVRPIVKAENLIAVRADDLYGRDIMEDIWKSIVGCRLVIADTTGRNPNVFYELGIAHTLGKDVVLLTQDVSDIPFDLNRYRHIVYEDNLDGYESLRKQLKSTIRDIISKS